MPFRTKDFLVFILTVAFLVVGIAATAKTNVAKHEQSASVGLFGLPSEEISYVAVLPESEADKRPSRLAALREKIAGMIIKVEVAATEPAEEVTKIPTTQGAVNVCSNFTKINPNWSTNDLLFEVVEGARIIYRNVLVPAVVDSLGQIVASSTMSKAVALQLPLRTFPLVEKTCLGTDIIGVAQDGSLMRNDEHALYKVFGSETLIGYALDGFPIYGLYINAKADECGGVSESTGYRYYLSPEREGILGCYSGIPVTF
jgi:hypothetical protein